MFSISQHHDLTGMTTFGIPASARFFAEYSSEKELLKISRSPEFLENEVLHIGGGSNLLIFGEFDGLVLHSQIKGIISYRKDDDTTYVIAGAGEKWTDLVDWCIERNLAGLENLAGIPGEVGASAVQNVGAYGVEAGDLIHRVECFDLSTRRSCTLSAEECRFGYRDSIFKNEGKGRYVVMRVAFRLKESSQATNLTYGPLKELSRRLGHHPSLREAADEILAIRASKLPDPAEIGSAGSFFKNPVMPVSFLKELETLTGIEIPYHLVDEGDASDNAHQLCKVSAAWLIDKAGMKGQRCGGARVYEKQPLVIVNSGGATAEDVAELAERVREAVRRKFYYIDLQPEVNYINSTIRVTVLGSGTSKGVPEIGCGCEVCHSPFEKDKRLRASILVKVHGLTLLIDASPDLRQQALTNNITGIDALLITHVHYDHVGGIDDLRPLCMGDALPIYLRQDVADDIKRRLDYCFRDHLYPGVPRLILKIIGNNPFYIKGVKITPVSVNHGKLPIVGFRIGDFAYITDAKTIPEEEKEKLKDLKVLILNALREREHFAHLSFNEALELIGELKPKEAYLTHFNHEAGRHHDIERRLPPHVHPCNDGLTITVK